MLSCVLFSAHEFFMRKATCKGSMPLRRCMWREYPSLLNYMLILAGKLWGTLDDRPEFGG